MPWRLHIEDKAELPLKEKRFCPPHYIPHVLPIIHSTIDDEPCHIHDADWRMLHHIAYCVYRACPNRKRMMEFYYGNRLNSK